MKKIAIIILSLGLMAFTADVSQLIKTKLKVTVLNKMGNRVGGAVVKVYETKEDYLKKENEVLSPKITNTKGNVLFVGLKKQVYFVYAEKDDMDNVGSGIQTDTLVIQRINKISTIVTDL